jgi:transposase
MPKKPPEWLNAEIQECYPTCQGNIRAIQRAIQEKRGVEIPYMTITERMKRLGLERPREKSKKAPRETPMSADDTPVEVLPGQLGIEDADTPAEVHSSAVGEFDALPPGYAKTIQPMRPYTDAEEWALNKSMELYGFIGTIVYDQYGRILDGNQRQRVARQRGLAVPYTITQVRDDAHAIEIARATNTVRRHYTPEQRQELAPMLRDQGFTYRAIADALGVGKSTVYRDISGELRLRPESVSESEIVPNGTPDPVKSDAIVPNGTISETEPPTSVQPRKPMERVKRKGGGTYPAQRPAGTKPQPSKGFDAQPIEERIKALYLDWLRRCEDEAALSRADALLYEF